MNKIVYTPLLTKIQVAMIECHLSDLKEKQKEQLIVRNSFLGNLILLNETILKNNKNGIQTIFRATRETFRSKL